MAIISVDFDPAEVGHSGQPAPGKCHLLVTHVRETEKYVKCICRIVAHDKGAGEVGKTIQCYLTLNTGASRKSVDFALATGIFSADEWAARTAAGEVKIDIPFPDAENRSFCTTLLRGKGDYADRIEVGWDIVDPASPAADRYPKDARLVVAVDTGASVDDVKF
jgi:hypothetical protein